VDVVIEMALERMARVKISEGRTQPIGANETVNSDNTQVRGLMCNLPKE
jgi:hypothetical protein